MEHTLDFQIELPRVREAVFPFFRDAFNLERITPPELRFRVLTPGPIEMGPGARILYRLRLWGVPFGWETVISRWEPPVRFVDEQVAGPYRRWVHLHEFVPTSRGTLVRDHVDYALPFSPVGEVVHPLVLGRQVTGLVAGYDLTPLVRGQLNRIFRYRQQALRRIFPGDIAGT